MDGPAGLGPKQQHPVLEEMRQAPRIVDGRGVADDRLQNRDVIERLRTGVLKHAKSLEDAADLAAHDEHRRAVGLRRGDRRHGVGEARAADAQDGPEIPASPRITVGHIGRPALLRRDDRRQRLLSAESGEKRVNEPARNHEQMVRAFAS